MIFFLKMRDVDSNKTSGQTKHNSNPSVHEAATCVYDFLRTKAPGWCDFKSQHGIKSKNSNLTQILVFTLKT